MSENTKDTFFAELRKLVIPIAIQSFMLSLVSITDAMMLGLTSQDQMASVSLAGQVQFILNLMVNGFANGVGIMTAQYWGKGDAKAIEKIAPIGMRMVFVIGGGFMIAALLVPQFIMSILTNEASLILIGGNYIRTVALSYLLCGITQVHFSLLKNTGHAAKSSAIGSFAVVCNIILNGVLIFGLFGLPALGVAGAALATVLTRAIELVLAMIAVRKYSSVQMRWKGIFEKADPVLHKDFYHYTLPIIGSGIVWGGGFMSHSIIMGHLGGDAVAANSVLSMTKNMLSCLIRGTAAGSAIMMGNLLGAGNLKKAEKYASRFVRLAITLGFCTGLAIIVIATPLMRYVKLTETARAYLKITMIFSGINTVAQAVNSVVNDGIFYAGGDSKFDMHMNMIVMWLVTLPLACIAGFLLHLPIPIVYIIMNADELIKVGAMLLHYRKKLWLKNITR